MFWEATDGSQPEGGLQGRQNFGRALLRADSEATPGGGPTPAGSDSPKVPRLDGATGHQYGAVLPGRALQQSITGPPRAAATRPKAQTARKQSRLQGPTGKDGQRPWL